MLALVGLVRIIRKDRRLLIFLVWITAYIAGYIYLHVASYYWYGRPVYLIWVILVAMGLFTTVAYLLSIRGAKRYIARITATLLIGIVFVFQFHLRSTLQYSGDYRAPLYMALCQWLNENTEPTQSVAYAEVGYLGYYSSNKIVDLLGLTSPEIIESISKNDFESGFWLHAPDYYIHRSWDYSWYEPLVTSEAFQKHYKSVTVITTPHRPGDSLTVYSKVQK